MTFLKSLESKNEQSTFSCSMYALILLFLVNGPINTVLVECVSVSTRASAMAIAIFAIHAFGDLWSPELVGRTADALGHLRYGMLVLPGAFVVAGIFWGWLAWIQKNAAKI